MSKWPEFLKTKSPTELVDFIIGGHDIFANLLEELVGEWTTYGILPVGEHQMWFLGGRERGVFCKALRSYEKGELACQECDVLHSEEAGNAKKAIDYMCHAGMLDFAAPIIVRGKHIATIFCGQKRYSDDKKEREGIELAEEAERKLGLQSGTLLEKRKIMPEAKDEDIRTIKKRIDHIAHIIDLVGERQVHISELQESASEEQRRIREKYYQQTIELLRGTGRKLQLSRSPKDLFRTILSSTREQLHAEVATIFIRRKWPLFDLLVRVFPQKEKLFDDAILTGTKVEVDVLVSEGSEIEGSAPTGICDVDQFTELYLVDLKDIEFFTLLYSQVTGLSKESVYTDKDFANSPFAGLGITGTLCQSPKPFELVKTVVESDKRSIPYHIRWYKHHIPSRHLEHYLGVPLRITDETIGVLRVMNKKAERYTIHDPQLDPEGFTNEDVALSQVIATQVSLALGYSELMRKYQDAEYVANEIFDVIAKMHAASDFQTALYIILTASVVLMNASGARIFLSDSSGTKFKAVCWTDEITPETELDIYSNFLKEALSNRDILFVRDISKSLLKELLSPEIRSAIVIPVEHSDNLIGIILIYSKMINAFTDDERIRNLVKKLSVQCAIVIQNWLVQQGKSELEEKIKTSSAFYLGAPIAFSISHQIIDGLGSIVQFLRGVEINRLLPSSGEVRKNANTSIEIANGLIGLSKTLLSLSKGIKTAKQWIYVNDVVRETLRLLEFYVKKQFSDKNLKLLQNFEQQLDRPKGITDVDIQRILKEEGSKKLPSHPIFADPDQIRNIVLNLVINAAKASFKNQPIEVNTRLKENTWVLEVVDHGQGIESEIQREIFKPFFSTTGGFGLGLYVCKSFVENHFGSIHPISHGKGAGATFIVEISINGETKL